MLQRAHIILSFSVSELGEQSKLKQLSMSVSPCTLSLPPLLLARTIVLPVFGKYLNSYLTDRLFFISQFLGSFFFHHHHGNLDYKMSMYVFCISSNLILPLFSDFNFPLVQTYLCTSVYICAVVVYQYNDMVSVVYQYNDMVSVYSFCIVSKWRVSFACEFLWHQVWFELNPTVLLQWYTVCSAFLDGQPQEYAQHNVLKWTNQYT